VKEEAGGAISNRPSRKGDFQSPKQEGRFPIARSYLFRSRPGGWKPPFLRRLETAVPSAAGNRRSFGGWKPPLQVAAPSRRSHGGFTLLEVLVAVSILGLGVAVTMQTFSGGLKNVRRIDLAHQAMGHAENIMNRLISDEDLIGPIQLEGDLDDEFDYSAIVDFWEPPQPGLSLEVAVPPVNLLLVEVRVRYKNDSRGKFYTARCLKLVPDPYAAPVNRRGSQSEMERILRGGR